MGKKKKKEIKYSKLSNDTELLQQWSTWLNQQLVGLIFNQQWFVYACACACACLVVTQSTLIVHLS